MAFLEREELKLANIKIAFGSRKALYLRINGSMSWLSISFEKPDKNQYLLK